MADTVTAGRGVRKRRAGTVVSKSGRKSIVVLVERRKRHPVYGKVYRQHRKLHAHDEADTARVGDRVVVVECRPMSRLKRWRLVQVVQSAPVAAD